MGQAPIDTVLVRAARLSDEGRPRAAIAVLESALEAAPDHAAAWCRLSAAYLDIGAATESLDAAKRAMTLGEPAWAHRLASLALVELGRHDEAVVSADEAVRRAPEDWRGLVTLSEALARADPAKAIRAARSAVDRAPTEPRTHEVLGDAAVLAHDWSLAESAYRDAVRLDPANADVVTKLDRVVRRPGNDTRRNRPPVTAPTAPSFHRAHRVAWFLLVRRTAVWQAVGVLALLLAAPAAQLAWYGLGLELFVGALAWRGWAGLPDGAHLPAGVLLSEAPLVVLGAAAVTVSVLTALMWTATAALGSVSTLLLVVALFFGVVAVANTWFGLWRVWARSR